MKSELEILMETEPATLDLVTPAGRAFLRFSTAVHEAGHAVIGRVLGLPCGRATTIRNVRKGYEGFVRMDDPYYTFEDWEKRGRGRGFDTVLLGQIMVSMAGREAECELLERDAALIGDASDLCEIEVMMTHGRRPIDLARVRRATRRLVVRHEAKIWEVGVELFKRRSLSKRVLDRMISKYAPRPCARNFCKLDSPRSTPRRSGGTMSDSAR